MVCVNAIQKILQQASNAKLVSILDPGMRECKLEKEWLLS